MKDALVFAEVVRLALLANSPAHGLCCASSEARRILGRGWKGEEERFDERVKQYHEERGLPTYGVFLWPRNEQGRAGRLRCVEHIINELRGHYEHDR